MHYSPLSFLTFLVAFPAAHASFYDNPEVELPAASGTSLDELKAKWDFDVSKPLHTEVIPDTYPTRKKE
jgi:hypothetical protein